MIGEFVQSLFDHGTEIKSIRIGIPVHRGIGAPETRQSMYTFARPMNDDLVTDDVAQLRRALIESQVPFSSPGRLSRTTNK